MTSQVNVNEFTGAISKFAFIFYRKCAKSTSGNLIISPLSVASALALLSQGTNGKTYKEIQAALHLNSDKLIAANQFFEYYNLLEESVGKSTLSIANHLYVQKGYKINKNFETVAVEKFSSGIEALDFNESNKSARKINDFIEIKTHQMIKDFIKPEMLNSDTRLILVNAIYFKGNWEYKFDKRNNFEGNFYINQTQANRVEFMSMEECFEYGNLNGLDATALEMKYGDSKFSFLIILPNSRTGLSNLEVSMEDYKLTDITSQMKKTPCNVQIPKFKVEFEIDLISILEKLGMSEMFDRSKANLSGLLESKEQLYVSNAIHKAILEVDEEGSKATAVTGLQAMCCSGGPIEVHIPFYADHPFLFHIVDKSSDTIIFSGRAENLKCKIIHHHDIIDYSNLFQL